MDRDGVTLVHELLVQSALRAPAAPALVDGTRVVSYEELDRLTSRCAHALARAGVRPHDRVVIALDNSVDLVTAYLGTMKAGAVAVPLPAGPKSDRLAAAVADCTPAAAVIDAATARAVDAAHPLAAVPVRFVANRVAPGQVFPQPAAVFTEALAAAGDGPPDVRASDTDLAAIIYTSGSTGEPRGVMLTHRNIVANARSIVSYLQLTESDRVMCVLPFYYVYGLSLLHTHLAVGGSVVIDNRFVYPNVVLRAMQAHAVTGFAGVPSTFALLLHRSELEATALPSLRYVTQAGGAMPATQIQEWLAHGPQVPFYVMYGATEASARLTFLDPARLPDKAGSIGKAIPGVEILVVKDDGTTAARGEVGELVARGANIAMGYWNRPDETRERFGSLGYRTGDLGYADDEGFLFLVGRLHDMLKVGAHRVGAREIEDVLHQFAGVHEVAVVPAPHDLLGEVPVAFMAMSDGGEVDRQTLEAFCHARLPPHKVPAHFIFRSELPKLGAVGKIDKTRLREEARTSLVSAID
jgi:amino acid adenylation domain-containing protein